jgi:hypothetical protein
VLLHNRDARWLHVLHRLHPAIAIVVAGCHGCAAKQSAGKEEEERAHRDSWKLCGRLVLSLGGDRLELD